MKKVIFSWLLSAMFISTAMAQFGATRTGFEGDNFSLEGALELFKDSRSVQDFERRLNTKTNWVNNLDLDYNGRTDYIRVNHRRQGGLNAIILQVPSIVDMCRTLPSYKSNRLVEDVLLFKWLVTPTYMVKTSS